MIITICSDEASSSVMQPARRRNGARSPCKWSPNGQRRSLLRSYHASKRARCQLCAAPPQGSERLRSRVYAGVRGRRLWAIVRGRGRGSGTGDWRQGQVTGAAVHANMHRGRHGRTSRAGTQAWAGTQDKRTRAVVVRSPLGMHHASPHQHCREFFLT